ncbi:MAG: histidine kinase dimerization/phospho-acceptor domain-containing protein [Planctomycetota bacterium]|jgi:signal transduction histidine kinase
METLARLLGEVRDAVFLINRDGNVLFANGRMPPGVPPSDAERFDERMPEPLRLPDAWPVNEARTERIAYRGGRSQPLFVRRRLVPTEDGLICILASEGASEAATRLEILGRLVGYVAHDLNNMLTAVSGHADLLLQSVDENGPEREWVEQIREAGRYAARLTHRLLAFGDGGAPRPRTLDLDQQIAEFATAVVRLFSGSAVIEFVPSRDNVMAWFDPVQLDQALLVLAFGLHDNLLPGGYIRLRGLHGPAVAIQAAPLRNEKLDPSFESLACARSILGRGGATLETRGPGWYVLNLPAPAIDSRA